MHSEANIIFGTVIDDTLGDEVRVTVIAAGFDQVPGPDTKKPQPVTQHSGDDAEKDSDASGTAGKHGAFAGGAAAATRSQESASGFDEAITTPAVEAELNDPEFLDDEDELDIPEFLK